MIKYISLVFLHLGLFFNLARGQQIFERDTIRRATLEERGINIVFMGDGYTAQQQQNFIDDVNRFSDGLFNEAPFSTYANYFNVYALKVISNDAAGLFEHGISAANLLTVNAGTLDALRDANFPQNQNRLFVVVLVNGVNVGSANAIPNKVLIRSNARAKVLVHEMGHAFGRLTDEYWTNVGEKANKSPRDENAIRALQDAGIDIGPLIDTNQISWSRWVNRSDNNGRLVGSYPYQGSKLTAPIAQSNDTRWYRPSDRCLMRFTEEERRFCPVCSQTIIMRIHELVSVNATILPSAPNQVNVRNFSVNNLITPNQNTLIYDWYIGDEDDASMFGSAIEIPISKFGGPGTFNVKVVIYDATPLIRINNGRVDGMEVYTFTWRVTITQQYYNQQHTVLPIILKDFSTKAESNGVKLTWSTLSEKDNDHFILEKSVDGKDFNLLATVFGNRTTNEPKSYSFFDNKPFSGTSYYRLTQVGINGDKNIIDTKSVNFSLSPTEHVVYPNPAHDYFYWKGKQNSTEDIEFTLTDIIGGNIYRKIEKYSPDPIIIKPAIKPKTGLYILRVKQGNMLTQNIRVLFQ